MTLSASKRVDHDVNFMIDEEGRVGRVRAAQRGAAS
jgi:hypothetical protein